MGVQVVWGHGEFRYSRFIYGQFTETEAKFFLFGLCPWSKIKKKHDFRKSTLHASSGKEARKPVNLLDRAILRLWVISSKP